MTLRMPGVDYLGPPDANWSDGEIRPPAGMVVHIAEGTYQGTISWQRNPSASVSSYFVVSRAGEITQMLDLDLMAWTQGAGNPAWVGVENEGFHTQAFTDEQITANARIFAWLRSVWPSVLAQISNSPNVGGLGWHGMGGVAWGNHPDCPGPPNVALLPVILARAVTALPQPPDPPSEEDEDMKITPLGVYQTAGLEHDGIYYAWISDGAVYYADTVVGPPLFPRLAAQGFDTKVIYLPKGVSMDVVGKLAG